MKDISAGDAQAGRALLRGGSEYAKAKKEGVRGHFWGFFHVAAE